ncbi:MAG: hypothetical protein AAF717_09460 [Bacteroidota bacterium]
MGKDTYIEEPEEAHMRNTALSLVFITGLEFGVAPSNYLKQKP